MPTVATGSEDDNNDTAHVLLRPFVVHASLLIHHETSVLKPLFPLRTFPLVVHSLKLLPTGFTLRVVGVSSSCEAGRVSALVVLRVVESSSCEAGRVDQHLSR